MKEILEKISSYNLFNYLLPGILFVAISNNFISFSFIHNGVIIDVFIYYFIGLIISRFGSLIIEPLLKKILFLKFSNYKDFVLASKQDAQIDIFSEVNNMYRTFCSMFILIISLKFYYLINLKFPVLGKMDTYILIFLLLLMFLFAYRKQTQYITKRINVIINK
jgi:hypothetical protein